MEKIHRIGINKIKTYGVKNGSNVEYGCIDGGDTPKDSEISNEFIRV
jgi:hypothetical protein